MSQSHRRGIDLHEPYPLLLLLFVLGLGTVLLDLRLRLAILWMAMMLLALAYRSSHPLEADFSMGSFGKGAIVGAVVSIPFLAFLARPLQVFSERLFATDDIILLFYQASFVGGMAEELFFRGVLLPEKGIWITSGLYAGMAFVYFLPHSPLLVTLIVAGSMFLLGSVYGYVRAQYGLGASVACHVVAGLVLNVIPSLIASWRLWLL